MPREPSCCKRSNSVSMSGGLKENGWGKSTLADVLRSLATAHPAILAGRKTLAAGPDQKAVLQLETNDAVFDGWA